ncbi:hypothetical protein ABVT39_027572 [Epinephelus coioides]
MPDEHNCQGEDLQHFNDFKIVNVFTPKHNVFISFSLSSPHTPTLLTSQLDNVDAAKVLTQTPAVHTVSTGQEAVLNCNIQRDDGYYVSWYKQRICYIVNRTNNESVTVMLCINDLTPGYLMNVLCVSSGSSLPPPVLTVFPPSSAELQSNKASLVCLSSQSVPFADVSWLLGGSPVSSGISTSTAVQQADQTFQISSYLAVQTSDWNMDKVYTCVSGVTVVTKKPPVVTLRKGETATMDCNLGTVTDEPAWWYKQIPGGVPQYVLRFRHDYSSPNYGSGFSSPKFTSTHQSTSDYRLIINNVEEGDSAVYYCKTWDRSAKETNNESVTVMLCINDLTPGYLMNVLCVSSGSSLPPPVLTVFPPSSAELQSNKASLVCLSSQSVPFADVSWLLGGSPVSSGISTSTAVQQADQTFQISSYLAVQTSDWNMDKVYTCVSGVTVVTQKPPVVTLRKGETATMDCNLGTVTDSYARWYKQIPGGVPQFVLKFYHSISSPNYGSGFSSPKFTSTHQSKSDYRLIINNVEEGDSAVYFCKTWDNSAKHHVSQ